MPEKPSTPAMIEISRKISAHFRIVIVNGLGGAACGPDVFRER